MIYIHIPFCKQRCIYCAFYSVATVSDKQKYVDALCKELECRTNYLPDRKITTIYIGGGTPSILSIEQLSKICHTIQSNYDIANVEEFTIEANPEQLTMDYLQALKQLGFVDRISIGVQTFDDDKLKILNRRHSSAMAVEAIKNAQKLGFNNISIDLIYGIPGMTLQQWQKNLDIVAGLNVQHLSCYALTVEQGTMLDTLIQKAKIPQVDDDETIKHYNALQRWIENNGFIQYEISNYCKQGFEAKHNSRYWDCTPYLGVGAAAHSFDGSSRQWNIDNVVAYIEGINNANPIYSAERLSQKDMYNEYIMTALRTAKGLDNDVLAKYRQYWSEAEKLLEKYIYNGMVLKTERGYKLSKQGFLFADAIAADLFCISQ